MQSLDISSLFQQLLHYRDQTADLSTLGPWLAHQMRTCSFPDLNQLPFAVATYTRTCVAREPPHQNQGFEALILRWDQGVQTPIHGHPAFLFYHVISGLFEMERFVYSPTKRLQWTETRQFSASETTWFWGQPGRYDNFIHRVTCLEPGHTFHVYSDDPQKGTLVYPDVDSPCSQSQDTKIKVLNSF